MSEAKDEELLDKAAAALRRSNALLSALGDRLALLDEAVKALRYYADDANWRQGVPATTWIPILDDCGDKARQFLARIDALEKTNEGR